METLILSYIDFNDYIYLPLTQCQLTKLHRQQIATASFVLNRYAHTDDILKSGWLLITERREF